MKVTFRKDVSNNSFNVCPRNKITDNNSVLFNVISYGFEEIGKNYFLKRAEFHGNMLTYIVSGTGNLIYKNKQYSLKKNDLILINCMDEQIMFPNEEGMTIYYFHIDSNLMADFAKNIEKMSSAVFNFSDNDKVKTIFETYIKRKTSIIDNVALSRDLYNLLIEIRLRAIGESENNLMIPEPLKNAISYIKDNYQDMDLSLQKIADYSNFNKFYLEKLFNKYLKTTVHNYLIRVRMANSRYLLLSTNLSIEEISNQSGFSSSQLLIKYFKAMYKETPLQYKKKRTMNGEQYGKMD